MTLRETLKFSLELLFPENWIRTAGYQTTSSERKRPDPESSTVEAAAQLERARFIIQELDHGRFGGPSFGPQTMALMSQALSDLQTSLSIPVSDDRMQTIAKVLLELAANGERDPAKLKFAAMSALETENTSSASGAAALPSAPPHQGEDGEDRPLRPGWFSVLPGRSNASVWREGWRWPV